MSLRILRPQEIPRLLEIDRTTPFSSHWSEKGYLSLFDESAARRLCMVYEEGPATGEASRICGFFVVLCLPGDWELENIVVDRASQRRGVGRKLLEALIVAAAEAGVERLMLEVRASNRAAIALYESAGFTLDGVRKLYYREPEEDALLMSLQLEEFPLKIS